MTNTYTILKGILIAKLEALVDEQTPTPDTIFAGVYGSNVTEPAGYPCAYVVQQRGGGKIVDTARNERSWEFAVVVHVATGNKTLEQADTALNDAVDRVVASFDTDPMLADTNGVERCKRVEVATVQIERAVQDVAVIRGLMTVKVFDLVPRF